MISVFWFRRDLRLDDNAGLFHALKSKFPVLPIFIFDKNILEELPKNDARVEFIHLAISDLHEKLGKLGSSVLVRAGDPAAVFRQIFDEFDVREIFTNHDFEPYAIARDLEIKTMLAERNIDFQTFKDHVIFEKGEILKEDKTPYTVFTPFSKKWLLKLETTPNWIGTDSFRMTNADASSMTSESFYLKSYPTEKYFSNFLKIKELRLPTLGEIGFEKSGIDFPPISVTQGLVRNYDKTRDFPAIAGTSKLGIHFRFGTISIREKARNAQKLNATFLNELIWRDFYSQILAHFPQVVGHPFKKQYDNIEWRDAPDDFEKWKIGQTGYPIVDAGMRELNATGFMHNRVRMIVASFLTKHLLLDWRLGEAYFAEKLLDFDLASNNGGWQWAAGCGTDAAPYFRIFNPSEQTKKFDPELKYIRKWVPELDSFSYPKPMVDHVFARQRCLDTFKKGLN